MPRLAKSQVVCESQSGARLLTAAEAARYLKYHPVSIRRLVSRGDLKPHSRVGKALLFLEKELEKFKYANPWASKKSRIGAIPNPPPMPSSAEGMSGVVTVDVEGRNRVFRRLESFVWNDVPGIRTRVESRFGEVPFHITIKSPDGCGYEISFQHSVVETRHYEKLRGRAKGGQLFLIR